MVAPNIFLDWEFCEMDILGLRRSGFIDEIEIKLSLTDFRADFKKTVHIKATNEFGMAIHIRQPKHETLSAGLNHCNYFSFLLPESLAAKCEIPDHAGLYVYYIRHGDIRVAEVRAAPRLHSRKVPGHLKLEIGRKMAVKYWHK